MPLSGDGKLQTRRLGANVSDPCADRPFERRLCEMGERQQLAAS